MKQILLLLFTISTPYLYGQSFAEPVVLFSDPDVTLIMSVSSADFDGDGRDDILMTAGLMNVFYQKNLGNGEFGDPVEIYRGEVVGQQAEPLDVDLDGDIDVIAAMNFDNKIVWIENNGDGTFDSNYTIDEVQDGIDDMVLEDVDDDGNIDVVVSTFSFTGPLGQIFWYRNMGDGTFSEQKMITNTIGETKTITLADFNGDGTKDLLLGTDFEERLGWMPNLGDGVFGAEILLSSELGVNASYASDIDNDGDLDWIIVTFFNTYIYENDGNGNFTELDQVLEFQSSWSVSAADIDSDGDPDILIGDSVDDELDIFVNDGTGFFGSSTPFLNIEGFINCFFVSDLDDDGDLDFMTSSSENEVLYFENLVDIPVATIDEEQPSIDIFPNPNNGNFSIKIENEDISKIEIYDINGRLVMVDENVQRKNVDVSMKLISGHYFVKVFSKDVNESYNERFFVR